MNGQPAPAYSATLIAYRRAFRNELRQTMRAVDLPSACRLLDVPCGDGFYAADFARRIGASGRITGVDNSQAYLDHARRFIDRQGVSACTEFINADVYNLPMGNDSYDVVWCARSLISLEKPLAALMEMKRIVKSGGTVAVLEDDELHRILINCPVRLELALNSAMAEAARERYGAFSGLSPARRIYRLLLDAGLRLEKRQTFSADRNAPFDAAIQRFLRLHFSEMRKTVASRLPPDSLDALDREFDPHDKRSFFCREDAELTCLTTLFLARK